MRSDDRISISVFVPTLNEERILSNAVRVIRALEEVDEVIVSDGASSDAPEIII